MTDENRRHNERWDDKYPKTTRVLEMLKEYSEPELELLIKDIIEIANTVKKSRTDTELISLGIEKIKGIMHSEQKQRWYDKSRILYLFMNSLSAMKEEDYENVIDSLFASLYRVD